VSGCNQSQPQSWRHLTSEKSIFSSDPYAVNDILVVEKKFPYIKITVHPQQRVNRKIISEPIPDGRILEELSQGTGDAKRMCGLQASGRI